MNCPKCDQDVSHTFEGYDPSVGIMCGGWYCDHCDLAIPDDRSDDGPFEDELR